MGTSKRPTISRSGIVISSFHHLSQVAKDVDLRAVVSILGKADHLDWPAFQQPTLRLTFDDTFQDTEWASAPRLEQIQQLVDFARAWSGGIRLFHCRAGSSRSVAAAMIAAHAIGAGSHLHSIATARAYYRPNRRMLALGDKILGGTTLIDAANRMPLSDRIDPWSPVLISLDE